MGKITQVRARQILDSRGYPTVEIEVTVDNQFVGRAAIPSGASTGAHEAIELRDGDLKFFHGKGVSKAIANVNNILGPKVIGADPTNQLKIDQILMEADGTPNKSRLGANAVLGVSLAALKAGALSQRLSLFRYVSGDRATKMPVPLMNVLNGGEHADNGLNVQEFMIVPVGFSTFHDALRAGEIK